MNLFYLIGWLITRPFLWLLFNMKVSGKEKVPAEGAFIIASNHMSNLDPPIVGAAMTRELHYFAKKELFNNKLFGTIIGHLNAIPVRRGVFDPKALSRIMAVLDKGGMIVIFPEGTRGTGEGLLPPKSGVGYIAQKCRVPIIPVGIVGSNRIKSAILSRKGIRVKIGEQISIERFKQFGDNKEGYRKTAEMVLGEIEKILSSMKDENQDR